MPEPAKIEWNITTTAPSFSAGNAVELVRQIRKCQVLSKHDTYVLVVAVLAKIDELGLWPAQLKKKQNTTALCTSIFRALGVKLTNYPALTAFDEIIDALEAGLRYYDGVDHDDKTSADLEWYENMLCKTKKQKQQFGH